MRKHSEYVDLNPTLPNPPIRKRNIHLVEKWSWVNWAAECGHCRNKAVCDSEWSRLIPQQGSTYQLFTGVSSSVQAHDISVHGPMMVQLWPCLSQNWPTSAP